MSLNKPFKKITKDDLEKYITKLFNADETYECYVPLKNLDSFPNDYQIGNSKLITYDNIPIGVKTELDMELKFRYKRSSKDHKSLTLKQYREMHYCHTWIRREIKGAGINKLILDCFNDINSDLNILRAIYCRDRRERIDINFNDIYFSKNGIDFGLIRYHVSNIYYWNTYDKSINFMNEVYKASNRNDIEERIFRAINLFGIIQIIESIPIQFSLVISSLEGLLLNENDSNYLGKRIAEKIAIIIESDRDKRMDLYKGIKRYYGMRSDFFHQKPKSKEITEEDLKEIKNIHVTIINRLIELSKNYQITQIMENKGIESLDKYIKKEMFS